MPILDPTTLDLALLPSVAFKDRITLPNQAAIYFVLTPNCTVLYVGRTTALCARWKSHHQLSDFSNIPYLRIAYMLISDTKLLPDIEKALISYFEPPFNGKRSQMQRVTVHLHLDRPVRQTVIGNLHMKGLTLQEFFEHLMQTLAADPALPNRELADIRTELAVIRTSLLWVQVLLGVNLSLVMLILGKLFVFPGKP